jgi:hypothetical protein
MGGGVGDRVIGETKLSKSDANFRPSSRKGRLYLYNQLHNHYKINYKTNNKVAKIRLAIPQQDVKIWATNMRIAGKRAWEYPCQTK